MNTRKIAAALAAVALVALVALAFAACPSPDGPAGSPPVIEMVWLPGGTFTMGSPVSETLMSDSDERPQHQVTLGGFWIGKYEVTQGQYRAVMGTNPSYFKARTHGENPAERPVECVSWYDALEFCNRLSEREGLTPYYTIDKTTSDPNNTNTYDTHKWLVTRRASANGYRLPTEAQWEYACRAGTTTPFSTGGSITTDQANYNGDAGIYRERTIPVGTFEANPWGLHDMHGNVWEWCWDWYGSSYYSSDAAAGPDPVGPVSGSNRVWRGGSWGSVGQSLRSA